MWKSIVEAERPQITIRCMCIAYLIPKAINTHPEYAILIAFPRKQWLHKRATLLRYSTLPALLSLHSRRLPAVFPLCTLQSVIIHRSLCLKIEVLTESTVKSACSMQSARHVPTFPRLVQLLLVLHCNLLYCI